MLTLADAVVDVLRAVLPRETAPAATPVICKIGHVKYETFMYCILISWNIRYTFATILYNYSLMYQNLLLHTNYSELLY